MESRATRRTQVQATAALAAGIFAAAAFYHAWLLVADRSLPSADGQRFGVFLAVAMPIALALWAILPSCRAIAGVLDRIRTPTARARRVATIAIGVLAAIAFHALNALGGRSFVPTLHDSNMHLVQAQLIAHGKLWATPHPLADQMETFFVFVRPVYAAIHFPGTSMLYAPLLLLGIGPAAFSSMMAGAVVGLSYRVIAEIVDGVSAALVVPLLLGLAEFRMLASMILSHHVVLVPVLLSVWACLRWRRSPGGDLRWAGAIGGLLGFAAITRPLEALAYAIALAWAIALTLRGRPLRRWLSTAATVAVAASPWIALQLAFDRHVTGHWLVPPYEYYNHVFHPGLAYGSEPVVNAAASIPTNLPQKVDYYRTFITNGIERYASIGPMDMLLFHRLPTIGESLMPSPLIAAFWPLGLIGLATRERRLLAIAAVAYLLLCVPYALFLPHYAIAIAPLGAMLPALGVRVVGDAFAGRRRSIEVLGALTLLALILAGLPGINARVHDRDDRWAPASLFVNTALAGQVRKPAILLSRYRAWDQPYDATIDNPYDEPVYTIDALWPQDSPIARFQDLGPTRNREIYQFFVDRGETRSVYLLDRRAQRLVDLGSTPDLLAKSEPPPYFATVDAAKAGGSR